MNESDALIADALRDLAEQAAAPPRMADAAWLAGQRRRRLSVVATSAAAASGAIAIAVVLSLALTGGPGSPRHEAGGSAHGPSAAGRVSLRSPIQFEQVASIRDKPCSAGADRMPETNPAACVHLTGTGMTITDVKSARVQRSTAGGYELDIRLTSADSRVFAALTRELAGLRSPHNQFAIIADGRVLAKPTVEMPMTAGLVLVEGFTSRAQAESVIRVPSR